MLRIMMNESSRQHTGNAPGNDVLKSAVDVFAHDAPVVDQPQDEDQQNRQQHAVDDLRHDDERDQRQPGDERDDAPRIIMPVKRP